MKRLPAAAEYGYSKIERLQPVKYFLFGHYFSLQDNEKDSKQLLSFSHCIRVFVRKCDAILCTDLIIKRLKAKSAR